MSSVRVASNIAGIILLILGVPALFAAVLLIWVVPALGGLLFLFALLFLVSGALLIHHATRGPQVPAPQPPAAPPTEGPTTVSPRALETTIAQPTAVSTMVRLATLSSPRGNLYVTGVIQEFGRSNFAGMVSGADLNLISRRHFKTYFHGGKLYIEDLGSTNGTFVNGVDIRGKGLVPLERGDRVNVAGVIELTVEY